MRYKLYNYLLSRDVDLLSLKVNVFILFYEVAKFAISEAISYRTAVRLLVAIICQLVGYLTTPTESVGLLFVILCCRYEYAVRLRLFVCLFVCLSVCP